MTLVKRINTSSHTSFNSLFHSAIKKIFSVFGYSVLRKQTSPEIVPNVFKTKYQKTALLSYIKNVFEEEDLRNDKRHTNRFTTLIIAETLNQLKFNVDVINYNDDIKDNFSQYDLVIGLGKSLDSVLELRTKGSKTKVIWFGTGCNPFFSNVVTIKRVEDFYKKNQQLLFSSSRYIKEDWPLQHEFADWIILHGASFARSTYRNRNISSVNAPVFINEVLNAKTHEEWVRAKSNYLWFGNGGAIHKGLDLVIESFAGLKDCNLHICGNIESEPDFFNHYRSLFGSDGNIIYHGFVDVEGERFQKILHDCAFVIYPSASEGNSPSVLTCMANGGLIPIVSKNADVDLNGYGVLINELTVEAVTKSIQISQSLSVEELKRQSIQIAKEIRHLHSFEFFKEDFKLKLEESIKAI